MKHWQIEAALQWELKFWKLEEARRKKSEAVMYEQSEEDSEDVMKEEDNWYEEWEEEERELEGMSLISNGTLRRKSKKLINHFKYSISISIQYCII